MNYVVTTRLALSLAVTVTAFAEVHSLTLEQTLSIAARQNADIAIARLDSERARDGIRIALDPFRPKVYAGSGLAYTYGYPNSIEGNAPSIFQVRTDMSLYNRPKTYQLYSAREIARGYDSNERAKAEDVAYQAADLFLTAMDLEHQASTFESELPGLNRVAEAVSAGVTEGTELPLEVKRARVNVAMSQQQGEAARLDADYAEMMLAVVLGYPTTDRVSPLDSDFARIVVPPSEENAADAAIRNSGELRQMQSNVIAKELDVKSFRSARRPQIDLVAQYALFAKYNYQQYFQKFQRNNFQIGASFVVPIFIGAATKGYLGQAYTDAQKIRIQMDQLRNRILTDTRHNYEQWKKAESIRDLARMQLDFAHEQVSVLLAQNAEGRTPLRELEQARLEESNRFVAFYDAEVQVARAKVAIMHEAGTLLASVTGRNGQAKPE